MSIDASELRALTADLRDAEVKTPQAVWKVVEKGALNIKNDARRAASGLAHAPAYPFSIGYDVKVGVGGTEAEIGPDKGMTQGALGNILEFGTVNNAPIPHLAPALDGEAPRFVKALEDVLGDVL